MKKLALFALCITLVAALASAATLPYQTTFRLSPATITLQSAATTGNGDSVDTKYLLNYMVLTISGTATVATGAVQVETADVCTYAGTWAPLGDPVAVPAGGQSIVQIIAPVGCLRARISTTVTGEAGTATVKFTGWNNRPSR